jgi:hypothetical protein
LYGFGGTSLSFGATPNTRTEQIAFNIVDMVYLYNAILDKGSFNKLEVTIHDLYLCMKIHDP